VPVVSLLTFQFKAEVLEEALAELRAVLDQTRSRPGCLGVDVVQDVKDATRITAVERWESLEADTAYRAWRAGEGKASPGLGSYLAGPPVLTVNELLAEV
jgi:quinol monooxygenase YgiN